MNSKKTSKTQDTENTDFTSRLDDFQQSSFKMIRPLRVGERSYRKNGLRKSESN